MAQYTGDQLMQALQQRYPGLNLNIGNLPNYLNQRAGQGADPGNILAEAQAGNYSEIPQAYANQYNQRIAPQLSGLDQSIANIQKQRDAQQQNAASQTSQINSDALDAKNGMTSDQANLGLLGSGSTQSSLNNLELQKANQLAQVALQNSQNEGTLDSNLSSLNSQRSNLLSGNSNDIFNQNAQLATLQNSLPTGNTFGFGSGTITGNNVDLSGMSSIFSNPYLMQQLSQYPDILNSLLQHFGSSLSQ